MTLPWAPTAQPGQLQTLRFEASPQALVGGLLAQLTGRVGSWIAQIWFGQEVSPEAAMPEGFMQHDQAACGIHCMMLMAV